MWYSGIIAAGLAGLGVVLYVVFKELLSSDTPQAVYAKAFERFFFRYFPILGPKPKAPPTGFCDQVFFKAYVN